MKTLKNIKVVVFDFDGVLTDNKVYMNGIGDEFVSCSRSDGLAFQVFRQINLHTLILSTEKNPVVSARAKKLKTEVIQAAEDKVASMKEYLSKNDFEFKNVIFIGNDLNDFKLMQKVGFSCCPSDSHNKIIEVADIVLATKGGQGVARELAEKVFKINFLDYL